jgi:hypothetical protein
MRLVQMGKPDGERRVAVVDGTRLHLLAAATVWEWLRAGCPMESAGDIDYEAVYAGESEWRLLPPVDHPEPARCLVSGTGLTHLASAASRDAMHQGGAAETDSARMYQLGVERGRPGPGSIGAAPEWFYKGTGAILRGHGDALETPAWAGDGGEEAEIAGVYWIDSRGVPCRIGMAQGNEFSDHAFEKRNYLNLAGSKLRTCAIGPELVLHADFTRVEGRVAVRRGRETVWSAEIATGEDAMCHSLANIEHHHFKFDQHRRPGDLHIHFFGASAFSFGAGVRLQDGDVMEVSFTGFGRPLRNPLRVDRSVPRLVRVETL